MVNSKTTLGACFGSVSFEAVGRNERSNKVVGLGEATTSSPRCLNLFKKKKKKDLKKKNGLHQKGKRNEELVD